MESDDKIVEKQQFKRPIRRTLPRPDTAVTQRNTSGQKRSRDATEENNADTTSVQNVFKKLTKNHIYGDNAYIRMYNNLRDLNNASNYNYERLQYARTMYFEKKYLDPFLYMPTGTVFLFIARHGGYDIPDMKYQILPCEVNNLITYTHAPKGTCSWGHHDLDVCRYTDLYDKLRDVSDVTPSNIDIVKGILNGISIKNQCNDFDYHEKYQLAVRYPNTNIFNSSDTNRITFSHFGDYIVNKRYTTETKKDLTSGVAILFDITFRLPDIFFNSDENMSILNAVLISLSWQKNLSKTHNAYYWFNTRTGDRTWNDPTKTGEGMWTKTGIYNETTQMITYEKNTELLSCPYFIAYVKLLYGDFSDNIVDAYSIVDNKTGPITVRRKMLFKCYSYDIYSYFKYVNTVVNIDFSCGEFNTVEEITANEATETKLRHLKHAEELGIHGGGKTKSRKKQKNRKQKTKKQKNRKQKTKHRKN